jgi:hypothetical protein
MKMPKEERANSGHWLDSSIPKYGMKLVSDLKIVSGLICLYLPLPVFWALFDQQVC